MIPSVLPAASFKIRSLLNSHKLTAIQILLFENKNFLKIIHGRVFCNKSLWLSNLENVLQRNLRTGGAFLEYLEVQILKISPLCKNHGAAFVGSMYVLVCRKILWIRHCICLQYHCHRILFILSWIWPSVYFIDMISPLVCFLPWCKI